jgi:hypothetical protein
MPSLLDTVFFLVGVYWPFMAGAALVGLVTGWLSLARRPGEGAS